MNPDPSPFDGWTADPWVLGAFAAGALVYGLIARDGARWGWFAAALAVVALAEMSPIRRLADGVLFSAHMVQHILLLLVAPALLLLSLPAKLGRPVAMAPRARPAGDRARERPRGADGARVRGIVPFLGWPAGVGAMWLWHVPTLCDAAVAVPAVRAVQTVSLIACGLLFWWPILSPRVADRLSPGFGIGYLFTACLTCSALGMLITLTPIEVCSAFVGPVDATNPWASLRNRLGALRDRQIGGLLMWVPMCLIYVAAIMLELARWFGARAVPPQEDLG